MSPFGGWKPEPLRVLLEVGVLTTGCSMGPGPRRGQTLTDPEKGPVGKSPLHLHFYPFTRCSLITPIFENVKADGDLYLNLLWRLLTRFEFHLKLLKTHLRDICRN